VNQLGWTDRTEMTNKPERQKPADVVRDLETLAVNLEPLVRRGQAGDATPQELRGAAQGKR